MEDDSPKAPPAPDPDTARPSRALPARAWRWIRARSQRRLRRLLKPRWAYLAFGGTRPASSFVGIDRGLPLDRFFIERYIEAHAHDIRGDVLEIKDRDYTTRFGGGKVSRSDVLDIARDNANANIYDDIRSMNSIADESYDCFICTQTLQYVDDLDAAIHHMKRVLRPGGTLLVTLPTVGKIDGQEEQIPGHYWRLTPDSARLFFLRHFPSEGVEVESWGNVRLAISFLAGFALEDVRASELAVNDPQFACGVFVRARKPG